MAITNTTESGNSTGFDYTVRRGEISAFGRAQRSARNLSQMFVLVGAVATIIILLLWRFSAVMSPGGAWILWPVLLIVVLAGLWLIWQFTVRNFIEPDLAFRKWLQQVCDGNLDARIDLPQAHRHYKELDFHTRNLASALDQLSDEMENLVETQTERLKNRQRVLEMLLRLTEDVAGESGKVEVLKTVTQHLAGWFGDATVSGYLTQDNSMHRVVLSTSGNTTTSAGSEAHPEQRALPDVDSALAVTWDAASGSTATSRVSVPFYCGQDIEGLVVVDIHPASLYDKTESERVLLAVSEQLSLFNNKLTAREQAQQARLMGERSRLAGDMHDSLAQTLLAARYKATLLHEELSETGESAWSDDVQKIAAAISEANQEIRELIREYRSPLADHRPVDSIQESIEQFRQSSGLQVFFQNKDQHLRFTPREELVVQRIIGEALINAEKYAKPTTIRVFMQYLANGSRTVLIEDDGAGFDVEAMISQSQENKVDSGEHIGLSIMQERALSIGAILTIESEPGDGTRVSLQLPPLVEPARKVL